MRDLVLATNNRGKVDELKGLLVGLAVRLHTAGDLSLGPVAETGSTFEENARQKALHYSRLTDHLVLSDDSGLEVSLLRGEPGVQSARFGGPNLSDAERCRLLLKKLEGTEWEDRTARFVCVAVLAQKGRVVRSFRGEVEGIIAFEPRGASGFGYDPIFYYPPEAKTFAEMTQERKSAFSHRGAALRKLAHYLDEMEG